MNFKVGDKVEWTSQAAGCTRTKVGEIVEVIPPGKRPVMKGAGMRRDHMSYVVMATVVGRKSQKRRKYWPRVSQLKHLTEE